MNPAQQLQALRKMAARHPRTGLQSALDKLVADETLNKLRDEIGYRPERATAQAAMLTDIPPMTAFMGMEG